MEKEISQSLEDLKRNHNVKRAKLKQELELRFIASLVSICHCHFHQSSQSFKDDFHLYVRKLKLFIYFGSNYHLFHSILGCICIQSCVHEAEIV